jgi:hypothetical protein
MKRKETEISGGVILSGHNLTIERIKKEMLGNYTIVDVTHDNGDKAIALLCVNRTDENALVNIGERRGDFLLKGVTSVEFKKPS